MTDQDITPDSLADTAATAAVAAAADHDRVLGEALSIIDGALGQMMQRELVSSGEVADLLLDVRTLLTSTK